MLKVNQVSKKYGKLTVLDQFSLEIPDRSITCILGPSGCGKTTLLNMLNGLTKPDEGSITGINNQAVSRIFETPRLLPWCTVQQNIELIASNQPEASKRTAELIEQVELQSYADYYPHQLSYGMQQRVAFARAFAFESPLLLMDEPFKGLDVKLKENLLATFTRLWKNDPRTVLFVTHDPDEALELGHELIVLSPLPASIKLKCSILNLTDNEKEFLKKQIYVQLSNEV